MKHPTLSAFGYSVEQIEELGEADGGGFGALDQGFAFGAESGDAEGHGDAVVAAGVDDGAVQSLSAGDIEAVFELFHFGTHGAEIARDEGDAVGLLDAEFFCIANADAAAGVGSDGGEDGEFVDELSGERSADVGGAEAFGVRVI